jgi:hypothetical protein
MDGKFWDDLLAKEPMLSRQELKATNIRYGS